MAKQGPCKLPNQLEDDKVPDSEPPSEIATPAISTTRSSPDDDEGDATENISAALSRLMSDPHNIVTATLPVSPKEKRFTSQIRREESVVSVEFCKLVLAKISVGRHCFIVTK